MTAKAKSKTPRAHARKLGSFARKIAHTSIMAAALAAAQWSPGEREPTTRVFDPGVVDRLHEPLSRLRE